MRVRPLLASATYPPYFVPSTREKVSTKEEDEEGNARFAAIEPLRPFLRSLPPQSGRYASRRTGN